MKADHRLIAVALLAALTIIAGCSQQKKEVDPDKPARELYEEAKGALDRGNYQEAVEKYEQLESQYPFGPYAEQAQLEVAYAYYKYDEPDAAISAAERFIRLHPRHEHVDYAYFLKGRASMERSSSLLDRWFPRDPSQHDQSILRDAYQAFSELSRRFPESRYTPVAEDQMLVIRNHMAKHEIRVARYYLKRGAWLAAVQRAQNVLETYQGAPTMPEALEVMIAAYEKLGMEDLAADTRQVLETNYPAGSEPANEPQPDDQEAESLLDRVKGFMGVG